MEQILLEVLKSQGIAVFLILIAVLIVWVWVLPEWKRQAEAREKQEESRQQLMGAHMERLVKEVHDSREEHRRERAETNATHAADRKEQECRHREDMREQRSVFTGMTGELTRSLRGLGREVARNTAITLASAVEQGADKRSIKDRADRLQARETEDMDYPSEKVSQ